MRIIIYTGKGGVGKTSVAAATAVRLAEQGRRTLVMSTDAAHSLSDALDTPLGPDPVQVRGTLWAQEVNAMRETERNWGAVQGWLSKLLDKAQLKDVTTEEMLVFPGLEELFSLLQIKEHASSGRYDAVVVDCAPTGETIRLLSYPNVLNWWLEKIFPYERKLLKVMRPVARVVASGFELPSDDVMNSIETFARGLEDMQRLLLDPGTTSVRIVLNAEKMVLAEAKRSYTYLNLFGFHTDAVVVNWLLPGEAVPAEDGFLAEWRAIQRKYREEIGHNFEPLPIMEAPMMRKEAIGIDTLSELGGLIFGESDPAAILYEGRTETIHTEGDEARLELAMPFVTKSEIGLTLAGDELTVHVGSYKRKVILPRPLLGRPVEGAKLTGDRLVIRFGKREKR